MSCTSRSHEMRVVEKSRQIEPKWIADGMGLRKDADGLTYTLCKEKVLDLPLGIQQAETSVLHNLRYEINLILTARLNKDALTAAAFHDFEQNLSTILVTELTSKNLMDFYFDKVSMPSADTGEIPEYYRVFVTAHINDTQKIHIINSLKAYLEHSNHADLKVQSSSIAQF